MSGVQSIERAFAVLRVLSLGPCGVTELATRTGLPKSTVARLLTALETEGAVSQADIGGDYSLGATMRTLGDAARASTNLTAVIRPFAEGLAAATGGSAGFTVRDGRQVYWVLNVDGGDALVQVTDQTGQSFPLHAVPSGLAVLAHLPADELDDYLDESLAPVHDITVTDPDELRRRLATVAATGLVVSREEIDPGINAVAAPLRGSDGSTIGGLYVQGPSFRFPASGDEDRVVELLAEAAARINDRLAHH